MHVYKKRPGASPVRDISKATFEEDTGKALPWYQRIEGEAERRHYAVCPECENPVQIIGLYKPLKHTDRPYGRHTGKPIAGFTHFDAEAHEWCPYVKRQQPGRNDRKKKIEGLPLEILNRIALRFPEMVAIIEHDTGISLSESLARKFLQSYLEEQGYLYTGATLRNVPWMIAYFSDSQRLFRQRISENKALHEAVIRSIPNAAIDKDGRLISIGRFINTTTCFVNHRRHVNDGTLVETMQFQVRHDAKVVHRQDIIFDLDLFDPGNTRRLTVTRREPLTKAAHEVLRETLGSVAERLPALSAAG